jgi:mRNA interferase MazF
VPATIKTTFSIPQTLLDNIATLAPQLGISPDRLVEMALETFVKNAQSQTAPHGEPRVINRGDIYWIQAEEVLAVERGYYPHPYVVIQDNLFNHSRLNTVVVCALTSNLKEANAPGNLLLDVGEANLPKQSVVVVSKVSAVAKTELGEYIGTLAEERVNQILAGMRFLHLSFFAR